MQEKGNINFKSWIQP